MQNISSFVRADAAAGLGAAGLNLIVASALVTLSLTLCVAVSLLAGLPAFARRPRRAIHVRNAKMSRICLLAAIVLLSLTIPASVALAEASAATSGAELASAPQDAQETGRQLLEQFGAARVSLTQAIEIAEGLHRGSRAAAAAFELSDSAGYRVVTVKSGETWENLIDANTGYVKGAELASPLDEFSREERSNMVALKSVAQNLSDAVRVAERAASGKAFGGGLMKQGEELTFFVVVLSDGGDLKEVRLEPPKAGHKGSDVYRLR